MTSNATERTALLGDGQQQHHTNHTTVASDNNLKKRGHGASHDGDGGCTSWLRYLLRIHVEKRILFAGFLITLSFSFTQVP
jgi:hypothetical protein